MRSFVCLAAGAMALACAGTTQPDTPASISAPLGPAEPAPRELEYRAAPGTNHAPDHGELCNRRGACTGHLVTYLPEHLDAVGSPIRPEGR